MSGGILALDLARVTGWAHAPERACRDWPALGALGRDRTAGVEYGSHAICTTGMSHGLLYSRFEKWLMDRLFEIAPAVVIFEAPLPTVGRGKGHGSEAARRSLGLAAWVDGVCYRQGVACYEEHAATVRKHFCGNGRATKDMVLESCRQRGWEPADLDAADALALLDYTVHRLRRRFAA